MLEIEKVLTTLAIDDFAGIYTDKNYPKSDEYGVYVDSIGVYLKIRLGEERLRETKGVLVISFHPLRRDFLKTRTRVIRVHRPICGREEAGSCLGVPQKTVPIAV